jgi:hypothetical protein
MNTSHWRRLFKSCVRMIIARPEGEKENMPCLLTRATPEVKTSLTLDQPCWSHRHLTAGLITTGSVPEARYRRSCWVRMRAGMISVLCATWQYATCLQAASRPRSLPSRRLPCADGLTQSYFGVGGQRCCLLFSFQKGPASPLDFTR